MVAHTLFNWHMLGRITGPSIVALKIAGKTNDTLIHTALIEETVLAVLALTNGDRTNSQDIDIII